MGADGSWSNQVQNQVIVSGPNGGVFVYDPSPGLGNLIGSITDAAHDPFGNATLKGVTGYTVSAGVYYAAEMGPALGGAGVFGLWTASSAAGPYTFQGGLSADSSGNLVLGAAGNLTLNTTAGTLFGRRDSASFTGSIPLIQVDTSTNAVGNTATPGNITTAWSIPAGDGVAGTTYVVKGFATLSSGATTAESLTIGATINGGGNALATLGAAFNGSALSTGYDMPFEVTLVVDNNGLNTPQVTLNATIADTSANRLSTNGAAMNGHTNAATWNKASTNTLAVAAQWGGAGGVGQNIQTTWSKLYREGP